MRPPLRDHLFHVTYPTTDDGWRWSIRGASTQAFGPYPSKEAAVGHRWSILQSWKAQAVRRGGYVVLLTRIRWVVVLPEGVPCPGLSLHWEPCTVHQKGRERLS